MMVQSKITIQKMRQPPVTTTVSTMLPPPVPESPHVSSIDAYKTVYDDVLPITKVISDDIETFFSGLRYYLRPC